MNAQLIIDELTPVAPAIVFRDIEWDELESFLFKYRRPSNTDVDQEVLFISKAMFYMQRTEGFFDQGKMVGFARWDVRDLHLSQIYVAPSHRNRGLTKDFINTRHIRQLNVMPHNPAKALYERLGFRVDSRTSIREHMSRYTA